MVGEEGGKDDLGRSVGVDEVKGAVDVWMLETQTLVGDDERGVEHRERAELVCDLQVEEVRQADLGHGFIRF